MAIHSLINRENKWHGFHSKAVLYILHFINHFIDAKSKHGNNI